MKRRDYRKFELVDVTISRIDGDLHLDVGSVGEWFPDDRQIGVLRESVRAIIIGLMTEKQEGLPPPARSTPNAPNANRADDC